MTCSRICSKNRFLDDFRDQARRRVAYASSSLYLLSASSQPRMDDADVSTVPNLSERLETLRTCTVNYLEDLVLAIGSEITSRLPTSYLGNLAITDRAICLRVCLICYSLTGSSQVPREMQLRAVLASRNGKDCLVAAGTGSGKTLPIALNILLDDPSKQLVTLTLSPLKRLHITQESDFNSRYGVPTVVINEDTPRDDSWWNVSSESR